MCSRGSPVEMQLVDPDGGKGKTFSEVADLSPKNIFRKQSATDGFSGYLNIGETRVWRLDSGPNLQPCSPFLLGQKANFFELHVGSL